MSNAQKKAQKKYEKKRVIKKVSFNQETEKDLIQFAESVNFSLWVKNQIKKNSKKKFWIL